MNELTKHNSGLEKKSNEKFARVEQGIIAYTENLLHSLDSMSDEDIDRQIEFACTIDEAAWLIRARCMDIKLIRLRESGTSISPTKLAAQLSKQFGKHQSTWLEDHKMLKKFDGDFFYLLPREIYKIAAKAPSKLRLELMDYAFDQREAGTFKLSKFEKYVRSQIHKFNRRKGKVAEAGIELKELISSQTINNLKKLMAGTKSVAGFRTKRLALEYAINSAAYQMMQKDARNLNLDITDVEDIRREKKESLYI